MSYIIGIDYNKGMVDMYNEIAKRMEYSTCTMHAYLGDILPEHWTKAYLGDPKPDQGINKVRSVVELPLSGRQQQFDMVILSVGDS